METSETSKGNSKKYFIAALIVMAILNGVTAYFLFTTRHEKETIIVEKTSLEGDYRSVMEAFETKKLEMEQLKGRNSEMDEQIAEQERVITEKQNELTAQFEKNTLTSAQLNAAWKTIKEYRVSIAELERKVEEFSVQNKQLAVEKEILTADLTCEKETNDQLAGANQVLTKKVTEGSFLQIPQVSLQAIKRKNNGQEVSVERIKAAESLKVSFETGVNKVLEKGTLPLYVRIINPRGETLAVSEQGSGVIPETENGKPVQFTKKANVQYTQTNKKVVVYWNRYITDPGTYKVEVYQEGRVVGRGAVRLS